MKIPEYYKVNVNLSLCANQISLSYCEVYFIELKKSQFLKTRCLWQEKGLSQFVNEGVGTWGKVKQKCQVCMICSSFFLLIEKKSIPSR